MKGGIHMEQNYKISVVVPIYNVEAYLSRCVDSILNQTYSNLEVILVDDGATDGSGAICDSYAARDSRVQVIHKENGGLSSARNAGIDVATGDFLTFVDSDDWIALESYEHMLALALKYDVPLVCAGRYDVSSETGKKTVGLCPTMEEVVTGQELARRIFRWENVDSSACDKLYRRELFREIRFPLGKTMEDVPTTYRVVLNAGRAAMCPEPIYHYFHRPGSISTSSVSEKTFFFSEHTEKIYAFIRENYPDIEPEARYLRVRSLAHNVICLELVPPSVRHQFAEQYRTSRRELRKHLNFILFSGLFSAKEKREFSLLAVGMYRSMRKVYHLLKKAS